MKLRRFTPAGLDWFRLELQMVRDGLKASPDSASLESSTLTEVISPLIEIDQLPLLTKREAATYLKETLGHFEWSKLSDDAGLWAWLSLFFFDSVSPSTTGKRKVLQDSHYVPDPDYRRRYRHLLLTPLRVLLEIPVHNALFLDAPLSQHGEIMEQLMSRLFLMRIPGVAEALEILYFDHAQGKPKRRIVPKQEQAGDLRNRFPARLRQLLLTYDISDLTGTQLIRLLGPEFNRWR